MELKRCIFHIPNYIDKTSKSGSSLRPQMMLEAFENIGYRVDYVMGYGEERKKAIGKIKQNIKDGIKYEFMYAENATTPTLLTEKDHFPRYPFLDFDFFAFCKKNGIKIGLFYRDIYWKFPIYKESVPFVKRVIALAMFQYDLKKYRKYVDILYLPSERMKKYVDIPITYRALPPGCQDIRVFGEKHEEKRKELNLFYVGGVGKIYDLTKLLQVVKKLEFVKLVICCRQDEWRIRKKEYDSYLNERITVVHKSGNELEQYYDNADICSLFFESEEYRSFAMPIKLFEYLGHQKPIIATRETAAGDFVFENEVGWSIEYDATSLEELLNKLHENPEELEKMKKNIDDVLEKNTWKCRAAQVEKDLLRVK